MGNTYNLRCTGGPLLSRLYVNDLYKDTTVVYLKPIMFAYDANLFYSHKSIKTYFETVNKEVTLIKEWFKPSGHVGQTTSKQRCINVSCNVYTTLIQRHLTIDVPTGKLTYYY